MGLADFFAKYKADRDQKALVRNIKRLIHQDMQHEDRLQSAEFLSEVGSDEALYGLLRRYDMSLEKSYMDQDEKSYVHDLLVAKGDRVLGPIKRFLRDSENLAWPERILVSVLKDETQVVGVLLEVLEAERGGSDMRGPKRANLLGLLKRYKDSRIAPAVLPFLDDFDETVRLTAVEVLDVEADSSVVLPLVTLLTSQEEESFRVKRRVVDTFVKQNWIIPESHRDGLTRWLPTGFSLTPDGQLKAN